MDNLESNEVLTIEYDGPSLKDQVVATLVTTGITIVAPFVVYGIAVAGLKIAETIKRKRDARNQEVPIFETELEED